MTEDSRLDAANQLLHAIGTRGRRFFWANTYGLSYFELDKQKRVWFIDCWSRGRIYTHYTNGQWKGFSGGGTLRELVIHLREWIKRSKQLPRLCFSPSWSSNKNVWGYPPEELEEVRLAAIHLGIIKE